MNRLLLSGVAAILLVLVGRSYLLSDPKKIITQRTGIHLQSDIVVLVSSVDRFGFDQVDAWRIHSSDENIARMLKEHGFEVAGDSDSKFLTAQAARVQYANVNMKDFLIYKRHFGNKVQYVLVPVVVGDCVLISGSL